MHDIDEIAAAISELNEGMTLDERILWWRGAFGRQAAELLIAEAKNLLIERHREAVAAARADRRDLDDYLVLLRLNERAERAEWLADRAEDQEAKAARDAAREQHQIDDYLRRIRADRAYRARLQDDMDFDEVLEMQAKEQRDLDDFWNLMLAIAIARALQSRVVARDQFARFLPTTPAPTGPDGPAAAPGM